MYDLVDPLRRHRLRHGRITIREHHQLATEQLRIETERLSAEPGIPDMCDQCHSSLRISQRPLQAGTSVVCVEWPAYTCEGAKSTHSTPAPRTRRPRQLQRDASPHAAASWVD